MRFYGLVALLAASSLIVDSPAFATLSGFSDVSGDSIPDFSAAHATETNTIVVLSGQDGAPLRSLAFFNASWTVNDHAAYADGNRDNTIGDPALVALATSIVTGQIKVQLRYATTGEMVDSSIAFFSKNWTAVAVSVHDDPNGDGNTEDAAIAVLAANKSSGRNMVELRAIGDGSLIGKWAFFTPSWTVKAVSGVVSSGVAYLAVLGTESSSGKSKVELRRISDGTRSGIFFFGPSVATADLAVVKDANADGNADDPGLLVLGKRAGGNSIIRIRRVDNGAKVSDKLVIGAVWNAESLAVVPDYSGNNIFEYAALAQGATGTVIKIRDYQSIDSIDTLTIRRSNTSAAPAVHIQFPGAVSLVYKDSVLVAGTTTDPQEINNLRVSGIDASTTDGFRHWRAVVPLQPGRNELAVETVDEHNNTYVNAASLEVERGVAIDYTRDLALDDINSRLLVVDAAGRRIVAVDLATGVRTVLSSETIPSAENSFEYPEMIAIDVANNRALVTDNGIGAIVAVDLSTGARTIFSTALPRIAGTPSDQAAIAVDATNNRLLAWNRESRELLGIDLTSGLETLIASNTFPDGANLFFTVQDIVIDGANNRALVLDSGKQAIIAMDLDTGIRTIFSNAKEPSFNPFGAPRSLVLDTDSNRVLVAEEFHDQIIAVDLDTGGRTILSRPPARNPHADYRFSGTPLAVGRGAVLDITGNRLLVGNKKDPLFAVDLDRGKRSHFSEGLAHSAKNLFVSPTDIVFDKMANRAYMIDLRLKAILGFDFETRDRFELSGPAKPDEVNSFDTPVGLALDKPNNRLLVVDEGLKRILAVNLDSGGRTVVASLGPVSPNPSNDRRGIVVDSPNDRALYTSPDSPAIVELNFSGPSGVITTTGESPAFLEPREVAVDAARNRILVADVGLRALVAVDMDSLERSIVRNFQRISDITIDPESEIALINSGDIDRYIPSTDSIEELVRGSQRAADGFWPTGFALDADNNRAFITDSHEELLWVIDLDSGERAIISN